MCRLYSIEVGVRSKSLNLAVLLSVLFLIGIGGACSSNSSYSETAKAEPHIETSESDPEIATALKLVEKMPDSPLGYTQLAILNIQRARRTGDFVLNTKAEMAVNRALEISPQDVPARKLQASLLLTFHKFSEALEKGNLLKQEFPNDAFVYGILTDANVELGNYEAATEAAQKMVDLKPNSVSYARAAHIRALFGDHTGAVEMYTLAARTTDPKDTEGQAWCLVQLGDEHFKYGKFVEAEKVYDEALSILPDFYMALSAKGKIRAAQNDLDGAEKALTVVLGRVPNVESAVLLGDIYSKTGDNDKAKVQYELVELMEQKIGLNNDQKRLALMWADQNIRLNEALEITEREHAERSDIFTEDAYAWCLYKNERLNEAKASITKAMRIKSNDARILYHAGMIEKDLGNRGEAIRLITAALKLNPAFDLIQSENAKQTLQKLRQKS